MLREMMARSNRFWIGISVLLFISLLLYIQPFRRLIRQENTSHVHDYNSQDSKLAVSSVPVSSQDSKLTASVKKKVYFLKMHKCASSTIASVLGCWGLRNHLQFVLPAKSHQFWPKKFEPKLAAPLTRAPDIFMSHVRDSEAIDKLMPPSETIYITAVRDPVTLLESLYNYFNLGGCLKKTFNEYFEGGYHLTTPPRNCEMKFIHNVMMFDLGMEPAHTSDRALVEEMIAKADRRFQLVLITERLEECFILFRDLIGASTDDMAVFKNNYRVESAKTPISNKTRAAIEQWNWADKLLYDHFKAKTYQLLEENKEYIDLELAKLLELQRTLQEFCIAGADTGKVKDKSMQSYGHGTKSYTLTEKGAKNESCLIKSIPETTLVTMIRKRQSP